MKNLYSKKYLEYILLQKAEKLGRTPTRKETPHGAAIAKRLGNGSWVKAVESVGLVPYEIKRYTKEDIIKIIQELYRKKGEVPTVDDFISNPDMPDYKTLISNCGMPWDDILYTAIGKTRGTHFSNTDELVHAFKQEYEAMNPPPKNICEFNKRKSENFPYVKTITERYGYTYNELKRMAGIIDIENPRRTKEEWIDLLRDIIEELGYVPSIEELEKKFRINARSFYPHLGSYNDAIIATGYEPSNKSPEVVTESKEELLQMYINYCRKLGKLASTGDLNADPSIYSSHVFELRFGSISNLKREANKVLHFNEKIYSKNTYTKGEIREKLIQEYQNRGRKLTNLEINQCKNLPALKTILNYFQTTKMSEVWNEILDED